MNILVFLDELYRRDGDYYYSKFNAGRFISNLKNDYNIKFAVPVSESEENYKSTVIENKYVIDLGEWDSLIGYLKKYLKNNRNIRNKLTDEIRKSDLVWLRYPSIPGLIIAKLCIKYNTPMIIHVAGDISRAYESNKYRGIKKYIAYILGKYMHYMTYSIKMNKKAKVTFLCTGSKLEKDFKKEDTQFFIDNETNKNIENKETRSDLRFLYVGRLVEEKGVKLLIDAWNNIDKNIELNIVGHGVLEDYVINASNSNCNIKYWGFKQGDELEDIYSECDCLIMPSINSEGFPRVIAEAWCKGLNVISSDVGGINGVGKDRENILLFKPGNMNSLIESINLLVEDVGMQRYLLKNVFDTADFICKDNMINIMKSNIEKYK